jgi:hypothetical protein
MLGKTGNRGVWVAGGGWARWRTAGGGVLVVREGGCSEVGVGWFLDFREERDGGEGFGGLYGCLGKMGERGGNVT